MYSSGLVGACLSVNSIYNSREQSHAVCPITSHLTHPFPQTRRHIHTHAHMHTHSAFFLQKKHFL